MDNELLGNVNFGQNINYKVLMNALIINKQSAGTRFAIYQENISTLNTFCVYRGLYYFVEKRLLTTSSALTYLLNSDIIVEIIAPSFLLCADFSHKKVAETRKLFK